MPCILNLDTPDLEHRTNFVFYASKDFIVYKDELNIVKASCSGEILARIPCPVDFHYYDVQERDGNLSLLLGGKTFIGIKNTQEVMIRELDFERLGIACTPLFPINDLFYFGTKATGLSSKRLQVVGFDFEQNKRKLQTSSWNLSNFDYLGSIGSFGISENKFFGILDKVVIVCWEESGKTLWSRTETDLIDKSAIPYKGGLLYVCQDVLKYAENGKARTIKIPLLRPKQLLGISHDTLYLQGNGMDIFAYDLAVNRINWTIKNNKPINKWVFVRGKRKNQIVDVAVLVSTEEMMVVDVSNGHYLFSLPGNNISEIRVTAENILIHKQNNTTDILAGE